VTQRRSGVIQPVTKRRYSLNCARVRFGGGEMRALLPRPSPLGVIAKLEGVRSRRSRDAGRHGTMRGRRPPSRGGDGLTSWAERSRRLRGVWSAPRSPGVLGPPWEPPTASTYGPSGAASMPRTPGWRLAVGPAQAAWVEGPSGVKRSR
jgi:hypothetical protein